MLVVNALQHVRGFLFLLIFVVCQKAFSQEDFSVSTSFYTVTPEYFNPAFTGERRVLNVSTLYYKSMFNVENAPVMQLVNVNSPMRRFSPISLGGTVIRTPIGPVNYNQFLGDFSYSVKLGRYFSDSRLFFGFRLGATNYSINASSGTVFSATDPFLPNQSENVPTVGLGVAYKLVVKERYHYRVGVALPAITRVNGSVYTSFSAMFMANIPFASKMVFSPSLILWSSQGTRTHYGFNASISFTNYAVLTGIDRNSISTGLGMLVKPQMYVGAMYKIRTVLQEFSNSGFEMMFRYDIFGRRDLAMKYSYANGGMFRTY